MEENIEKVTTRSVGIRYGLYSALAGIILFLIPAMLGQNAFKGLWTYVGMAVSIVLFVLAHKYFKDEGDGFMSLGQGVGIGFWMSLVSVIIGGLFTYIYISFIDSSPFDLMLDENIAEMEKAGSPDNAIEMAQEWTKKLFWPLYFVFGIIGGVVFALIISIFTKKSNPETSF
jgi:hypothetical protein